MSAWESLLRWLPRPRPRRGGPPAVAVPSVPVAGWWRNDAVEQLRNYQSWVYAAVNAVAQEVARQRPYLYVNTGQAEHEQAPLPHTHPLARLLARPNPWTTPWELWYLTVVSLELTGNAFWYCPPKRPGSGQPGELWVVPTPWVRVVPDAETFVKGYVVAAPGGPAEAFAPDEIVHLKYPNPLDPHWGLSPLQANALTVDANTELLKARYQAFRSGQRPGIVLATEQTLSDATVRRLEEAVAGRFAGRENWHRPLVLEQGLKASPWTLSPAEMDFLISARLGRDEILAVYRVPAPVAGLVEHTGLGAEIWHGARVMFCEGTVQPKLELIGQCLTRDLGRRYGSDIAVAFPECSPRDQAERRRDDEADARLGLRTVNEIRRARGLAPYPDPRFDRPAVPRDLRDDAPTPRLEVR
jgi:HK97 family phage portal protein